MQTKSTMRRVLGAVMITVAIAPWVGGGLASADSEKPAPPAGDARATSYSGNAVTCADAGLAGSIVGVTSTDDGTYVDITATPAGVTVTGAVVKGGDAYNVYLPGTLGSLPWSDLHAPLNLNEKPAGISHWYVCATGSTTTTSAPATTTTSAPATTTTSAPATTTTSAPATAPVAGTTTAVETTAETSVLPIKVGSTTDGSQTPEAAVSVRAVKTGGGGDVLAETGFGGLPLGTALAVSLGLLLGGATLLFVPGRLVVERGRHRRRH